MRAFRWGYCQALAGYGMHAIQGWALSELVQVWPDPHRHLEAMLQLRAVFKDVLQYETEQGIKKGFPGGVGKEEYYKRLACIDSRSSMATGFPAVPRFASMAGVSAATSESNKLSKHLHGPHSVCSCMELELDELHAVHGKVWRGQTSLSDVPPVLEGARREWQPGEQLGHASALFFMR